MPGAILHQGANIVCQHGGQASPTEVSERVKVSGDAIVTIAPPYSVAGCPLETPCATARWVVGAIRVLSETQPVAIMSGAATCVPTGAPLMPQSAQTRVIAA